MTESLVGPAVIRRRLGAKLKELRGAKGYPLETVARTLEFSTAKLSRLETGQVAPKTRDVRDLLEMYDVPAEVRGQVMDWTEHAKHEGWWQPLPAARMPVDLDLYISLEAEAESIKQYSSDVVPGLLQNRSYARAVLEGVYPDAPEEARSELVDVRIGRQAVLELDRPDAPPLNLFVVLSEAALHRGRPPVLQPQLEALLAAAKKPNVTIQVFPFSEGFDEASSILTVFAPREDSDWPVVNVEGTGRDHFYDDRNDVAMFERIWLDLTKRSLSETDSLDLIRTRLTQLSWSGVGT